MHYKLRTLALLAPMVCTLTIVASSQSQGQPYYGGGCSPGCVCPQNYNGAACSYDYPYGLDYYNYNGGDWTYGSRRHDEDRGNPGNGVQHGGGGHHGR